MALLLFAMNGRSQVIMRYGPNIDAGYGEAGAIFTPYVTFPASFTKPYAGNKITKVRIGMNGDAKNVTLYFRQNSHDTRPAYSQKIGTLSKGWTDIVLDTPYEIVEDEDIAIGYKATAVDGNAAGYSSESFANAIEVYSNNSNSWKSIAGSFCIQALVEGSKIPQNEMLIGNLASQTAGYEDTEATFTGIVRNVGANEVSSYSIAVTLDGSTYQTLDIQKSIGVNESDTFHVSIPATEVGTHALTLTIQSVNGVADAYEPNNTASATLTVRDKTFQRRVLCEEVTGTWCGWCPRGLVGLELMKQQHPETFIAVSIHWNDKLEIDEDEDYNYMSIYNRFDGAPNCIVDRKITGDPFYDISKLYNSEINTDATAALDLTASWNEDSTSISVNTSFFSAADIDAADWNMAFTLTEDSVTGYAQANYYAGGGSGEFYGWESKDSYTTDFAFNDLARGIFSNSNGDACHRGALKAMEKQSYTYTFSIPPTVENKKQLHVVGILLDTVTGFVINAAQAVPTNDNPSGILSTSADFDSYAGCQYEVFNQAGVSLGYGFISSSLSEIKTLQKGLSIVKLKKANQVKTIKIIR